MLQNQMQNDKLKKEAMDQAERADDTLRAQQAGMFHLQREQAKRDQKSQ